MQIRNSKHLIGSSSHRCHRRQESLFLEKEVRRSQLWSEPTPSTSQKYVILARSQTGTENRGTGDGKEEDEDVDVLRPEEDWTVPGGYQDSLSKNTKLGKAVDEAVAELNHLGNLEAEQLEKANELLRKLGIKSTSFPKTQSHEKD